MSKPSSPHWQRSVAVLGVLMWILALAGLGLLWFNGEAVQASAALLAVVTFYYAGQFGAMPLGLAAGGDPWLIALYVWAADLAGLFVFFPLTQYGVDRLHGHPGLLGRWIQRMRLRADKRRTFIERYGPWGLFGFTLLPFLFNSPILGAVMGRVVGLPARKTLLALSSAITLMTALWVTVFALGLEAAATIDERLPWVLGLASVAITLVLAGSVALVRTLRGRRAPVDYAK
jgi:uncharacterized membrane protein